MQEILVERGSDLDLKDINADVVIRVVDPIIHEGKFFGSPEDLFDKMWERGTRQIVYMDGKNNVLKEQPVIPTHNYYLKDKDSSKYFARVEKQKGDMSHDIISFNMNVFATFENHYKWSFEKVRSFFTDMIMKKRDDDFFLNNFVVEHFNEK